MAANLEGITVTLAFPIRVGNDKTRFTYVDYPNLDASVYADLAKAKAILRQGVKDLVDRALEQVVNRQERIIGCGNGDVLLVQFRYGNWGYSIVGPGRNHASGVSGWGTMPEAVNAARAHAADVYGGVTWEVQS